MSASASANFAITGIVQSLVRITNKRAADPEDPLDPVRGKYTVTLRATDKSASTSAPVSRTFNG